jgi:class 3 adenylate cyclase
MEPQIRYCKTDDGFDIAFYEVGEGPALVWTSSIPAHLTAEFGLPRFPDTLAAYSSALRVVRYDGRSVGVSQREPFDFALDSRVRDLRTVVDHLGLERFALFGTAHGTMPAIAYAAAFPERVSDLILVSPFLDGQTLYESSSAFAAYIALESVTREQWDFFVMTVAQRAMGYNDPEGARSFAAFFKAGMTPDSLIAYRAENRRTNVYDRLPAITARTLVIAANADIVPTSLSREVAANIKGAQFVLMEDANTVADDRTTERILDFLSPRDSAQRAPRVPRTTRRVTAHGTAVILFADVVGSTELTERIGDAAFRAAAATLDGALRAAVSDAGGTVIDAKTLGDGIMATFASAAQAIEAARRFLSVSEESELGLHIGLHAGDVIREDGNVFGGAVNIASRICGLSMAGEILVSDIVRGLARTSAGVTFEDRGERELKGIAEPVRVYAVREGGA